MQVCLLHRLLCPLTKTVLNEANAELWRFSTAWYGTVRFGTARYGTVRLSSGRFAFPLQFSTAIEWAGLFTRRYSCAASTAVTTLYTCHKQTPQRSISTGIVLFILGMWMFLTAMEKPMTMLGIYPQQQRLWWQCHSLRAHTIIHF